MHIMKTKTMADAERIIIMFTIKLLLKLSEFRISEDALASSKLPGVEACEPGAVGVKLGSTGLH